MNTLKKIYIILWFTGGVLYSQETLKSDTEAYYDFLALQGLTERPYLNYRTLSDSVWRIDEGAEHPWQGQQLGTKWQLFPNIFMRIYGPELFTSLNTTAPYGQNDGALWQGRGFNASLSGGVRAEGYGVELTFKPQLAFSQNAAFDYIQPAYSGDNYDGKAADYGYYGVTSIDAPQRFGNEPFFTFDWGDSEVRYTWKTLTVGFGTQTIWLGPGRINSILHSNNAPTYPKLDIGLKRTAIIIPKLNWYIGDLELRLWAGYLSESDYFDQDDSNNHNLISALSVAYAPSFLPGFTLFVNRNFLAKWNFDNFKYITELFFVSLDNNDQVQGNEDQRGSLGVSWLLPGSGVEVYGELGINDYVYGKTGYIRYPFHTMTYTIGLRKAIPIYPEKRIYGELLFEWMNLEMTQDFQFQWASTFYAHHQITQGYTNRGQWIGAGIGTGGNSQYLGFKVYHQKGYGTVFISRNNPDNDYLYATTVRKVNDFDNANFSNFKANLAIGIESAYFITKDLSLSGGFIYNLILNPLYNYDNHLHNIRFELGITLRF
jgi:hypothetical protein